MQNTLQTYVFLDLLDRAELHRLLLIHKVFFTRHAHIAVASHAHDGGQETSMCFSAD
jgi:hypothetical protein